jgi:hypothetical protein
MWDSYPTDYSIRDGVLTATSETYSRKGEPKILSAGILPPAGRAEFSELHRFVRSWLHGRRVVFADGSARRLRGSAVIKEPLVRGYF